MCMDHAVVCSCGAQSAHFHYRDSVLPAEAVRKLYCPECSAGAAFDPLTMIRDNGWVIEYDMEIARFMMHRVQKPGSQVTPDYLFDEGYCTWNGMTPTDIIDSARERQKILKYAKSDPKKYFDEFKVWGIRRMERLAREGWRKAGEGEPVNSA